MSRSARTLLLLFAVALLALSIGKLLLRVRPQQVWVHDYMASISSSQNRYPREIEAFGSDALIEHGLFQPTAVYSYDGTLRWEFHGSPAETPIHTSIGPELSVYVGTNKNAVYAYDSDGHLRWKHVLKGTHIWSARPAISPDSGTVYVSVTDEVLYALDSRTGETKWHLENCASGRSAPIPADKSLYTIDRNLHLNAYQQDGTYLGQSDVRDIGIFPPRLVNGVIFTIDTLDGKAQGISTTSGERLWAYNGSKPNISIDPLVSRFGMVVLSREKPEELVFLDSTGKLLREEPKAPMFTRIGEDLLGRIWIVRPAAGIVNNMSGRRSIRSYLPVALNKAVAKAFDQATLSIYAGDARKICSVKFPCFIAHNRPIGLPNGDVAILGSDGKLYCYRLPTPP